MKKYNTLFVVILTILVVALLTWILPVTYLNGELVEAERFRVGVTELFSYPVFTYYNFIYVFVYLVLVGGMYGLLGKTGAYRLILDKVSKHVEGREKLCLILFVILFSIVVSFTGFTFEALMILPFIVGIVLLLGYDKITAAMVTVGSITVGVVGTTFSNLVAGTFNEILNTDYFDLIWVKVALLLIGSGIVILNVILHTKKIEKSKTVEEGFFVPSKVKDKNIKVWPLATILICFIIIMIISTIDWQGAFEISFFDNLLSDISSGRVLSRYVVLTVSLLVVIYNVVLSLIKRRKAKKDKLMTKKRMIVTIIFGVIAFLALLKIMLEDVFNVTDFMTKAIEGIKLNSITDNFTWGQVLGNMVAFGSWTYNDYFAFIIIVMLIIKLTYHVKFSEGLESIGSGVKNVLYAVFTVMLAYTVLIMTSSHPVILTILKPILNLSDGLSILWYPISTFISALLNTDFTYYKYGALTLSYATTFFSSTNIYPLCGLITQAMYGLALMVAPTSSVLLFTLGILDIKYTEWFKKTWKLILELVLIIFISFIIVLQFLV